MVDRQLIARLDAARASFCLVGDHALMLYGCTHRQGALELLAVDTDVLRPLFWDGLPPPMRDPAGSDEQVIAWLRWADATPCSLIVGRGHAMKFALDTARFHPGPGLRVATPLGLILVLLELGRPATRGDVLDLVRAQESRLGSPWRPPVQEHLAHMSPAALSAWRRIELDLGAPT